MGLLVLPKPPGACVILSLVLCPAAKCHRKPIPYTRPQTAGTFVGALQPERWGPGLFPWTENCRRPCHGNRRPPGAGLGSPKPPGGSAQRQRSEPAALVMVGSGGVQWSAPRRMPPVIPARDPRANSAEYCDSPIFACPLGSEAERVRPPMRLTKAVGWWLLRTSRQGLSCRARCWPALRQLRDRGNSGFGAASAAIPLAWRKRGGWADACPNPAALTRPAF